MTTVKEYLNKPVLTIADGKKLGKIKDLYFNSKVTRVTAVSLGSKGFIRRKKLMIDLTKVQTFGIDAWLVASGEVVVESKHIEGSREFVPASELKGRQILSEGGTEIASVDSILLDEQCNVKGFSLDKAPESGPLALRKAIAREAISDIGSKNGPMTTTLAEAESMELTT